MAKCWHIAIYVCVPFLPPKIRIGVSNFNGTGIAFFNCMEMGASLFFQVMCVKQWWLSFYQNKLTQRGVPPKNNPIQKKIHKNMTLMNNSSINTSHGIGKIQDFLCTHLSSWKRWIKLWRVKKKKIMESGPDGIFETQWNQQMECCYFAHLSMNRK